MLNENQDEEFNGIITDFEMHLSGYDPVTNEMLSDKERSRLGYNALERLKDLWEDLDAD